MTLTEERGQHAQSSDSCHKTAVTLIFNTAVTSITQNLEDRTALYWECWVILLGSSKRKKVLRNQL